MVVALVEQSPLDRLLGVVRLRSPEVAVSCVRSDGEPEVMRLAYGQLGPYMLGWDAEAEGFRWRSGPERGEVAGGPDDLAAAHRLVVAVVG